MRFVVTGEWRQNTPLRLILLCFAIYALLFWVTNGLLFFHSMSLSPSRIAEYYLGHPDEWGGPPTPRSYKVLLEISHAHIFAMGILNMTMTHLFLFVPARAWIKSSTIMVSFTSALLDEASGWLIVYVHPAFAYMKSAAFLSFQLALFVLIVVVFYALFRKPSAQEDAGI